MKLARTENPSLSLMIIMGFFFSGICGLVYQVSWLRVLSLTFGNTTFATSAILSSYMAGLGLGAYFFGKKIESSQHHPLKIYAWLEGGVALFAFITPLIWKIIEWVFVHYYRTFSPSFEVLNIFKFILVFIVLFIPTFLMGGTLPVVVKFFERKEKDPSSFIGFLYAVNTFGAVLGVLLTGFYLLQRIGVWQTVYLAGFINLIIFFVFFQQQEVENKPNKEIREEKISTGFDFRRFVLLCLFGISGAVSMMYEVGWTRALAMILGSSVYAFSSMLACFLLGISIGSYLFSLLAKKIKIDLVSFSIFQLISAGFVLGGINQFMNLPYYFVQLFEYANGNMAMMELGKFLICLLVMLPPTIMIGAIFPCFIEIFRGREELGKEVGTAYFANTVGTILGAALTGFMILPLIGIQKTIYGGATISILIAMIAFLMDRHSQTIKKLMMTTVLLVMVFFTAAWVQPWNNAVISSDTAVKPEKLLELSRQEFLDAFLTRDLIYYKEGHSATVSVVKNRDNLSLAVNGKVDASIEDGFTQYLLGHLPMMLHPNAEKVLVIGLGSGSTVAAVASYAEAKEIHAVELEGAVVEASKYFSEINRNVLEDPRVKLFVNDGRNFVLMQPDMYDVIVSEPSNPWMAGVANLFSKEHFEKMVQKLNPNGMVCQWLHAYSMSTADLQMIIKTFGEAFPSMQLWTSYYPDLMLVGYREEQQIDFSVVQEDFKTNPWIKKDLGSYGIETAESLFASYWLNDSQLRQLSSEAQVNSDNYPYLEFSAPKNLYAPSFTENFHLIENFRDLKYPFIKTDFPIEQNAFFYQEMAKSFVLKKIYGAAVQSLQKANQLSPNDPRNLEIQGMMKFATEQTEEAFDIFKKLHENNFLSVQGQIHLGSIYFGLGEYQKALEIYAGVLEKEESPKALEGVGSSLYELKQYPQALFAFEKYLAENGANFNVMNKIVEIHLLVSSMSEKIEALNQMAVLYPRHPPIYLQLGQIYESTNQLNDAKEVYLSFLKYAPGVPSAYLNLARVEDKMGNPKKMKYYLRKVLKINPDLKNHPQMKSIFENLD